MKLRILYHHRVRDIDGQSVHVRALQRAFVTLGHELHEVALTQLLPGALQSGSGAEDSAAGGRTRWQWVKRLPSPVVEIAEHAFSLVSLREVTLAARRFSPEVIYERYAFGNVGCVLAARRLGIPHVLEVNSPFVAELVETRGLWLPRVGRWAERFLFSRTDLVCVVSEVLRDMVAAVGIPRERILLTRNGVDLEWFDYGDRSAAVADGRRLLGLDPVARPTPELVVGFTGFPRRWNRLHMVLEAMARRGLEHVRLVMVGTSPLVNELMRTARRLGVDHRVVTAGPWDHRTVARVLPTFDVMVLPGTSSFSSPLKLHEWMAAGQAVIAADQPNLREILEHDRNCLLFAPRDVDALAAALLALSGDPERRARLGDAARKDVSARKLTWTGNAEAIVDAVAALRRRRTG